MSVAPSTPVLFPASGTEPNLYLLSCERCGEPMYHFFRLEGDYPLCLWWAFKCGECGRRVDAWEDKPISWPATTYDEPGPECPA